MTRRTSTLNLLAFQESQAAARLARERSLNDFFLRRNPRLQSTERYERGPLPSTDPRFGSRADYIEYEATREMGRFDPYVKYPAPARRRK